MQVLKKMVSIALVLVLMMAMCSSALAVCTCGCNSFTPKCAKKPTGNVTASYVCPNDQACSYWGVYYYTNYKCNGTCGRTWTYNNLNGVTTEHPHTHNYRHTVCNITPVCPY